MDSPAPPQRMDSFYSPAPKVTKGGLLKDKLELVRVEGHDGSTRYSVKKLPDQLPFDKGLYVFVRAIQLLTHKNDGTIMVGLAGASGSGKTTFSQKLQSLLPGITVLSMDMYNDSSKLVDGNFDDPRLTDYDLLLENLTDLKEGRSVQVTETVYPMYKAFIEPDLQTAQLSVVNNFNPFSGFMNPIYTLKSCKPVTHEAAEAVLQADHKAALDSDTYDIYLLPPGEDPETCTSWLRMRNRDGRYTLFFEESMVHEPFVISPRVQFEVSVRVLGGLMSLGYEISIMMKRSSVVFSDANLHIKFDTIDGINQTYIQVQGRDRDLVLEAGRKLGLEGTYIARSYIELVQFERLTSAFQTLTEDLRRKFAVEGELSVGSLGRSPPPPEFLKKITGFDTPDSSRASWGPDGTSTRAQGPSGFDPASPLAVTSQVNGQYRHANGHAHPAESSALLPIPGVPQEPSPGPRGAPGGGPSRAGSARPVRNKNGLLSSAMGNGGVPGPHGGPVGALQYSPGPMGSPPHRARAYQEAVSEAHSEQRDGAGSDSGARMERAMSKMALKMEELMAREDKSGRTDVSDNLQFDQVMGSQQQLLREVQHLSQSISELSLRLTRSEALLTSTAVVASVCMGAVAAVLLVRGR